MKIVPSVTYLKNAAVTSPSASTKESGGAHGPAPTVDTAAGSGQTASTTHLLPSTNGEFDAARVAEIRQKISAGSYQVNTAKIADGLLATVRALIGERTS